MLGKFPNERPIGTPSISYRAGRGRTKFNDAENKASGFYSRMVSANKAMGGLLAGEDKVQGTPDDVNSFNQSALRGSSVFWNELDKQRKTAITASTRELGICCFA